MKQTTIEEARRWASLFLKQHNREPRVADLLLEDLFELNTAMLMAYERDPFPKEKLDRFTAYVKQHAETGIPVQHLIGAAHFYGRVFTVNEHVLIPRPETEELIEGVRQRLQPSDQSIADIGTGSGIIAITLQLETRRRTLATDLSKAALQTAKANAENHKAQIEWFCGDFLEPLRDQTIDVLVSNPPYIARDEMLDDTVKNFDPGLALFADNEGLAAYQTIIQQIARRRQKPRVIAFEIGHQQGEAIKQIIHSQLANYQVTVEKDINKKDRMIFAILDS
ncbi:release factor glutamine methyltransferase [Halobacillus andaensis]|uniref:peptide chain release factor N(5)-glutamine methyltransferase n=1 Tax=Halobacillus andaensis TaxID=1176239 RepID=A0A917B5E8_HALAA|nr:peptide chain release factor N(5)-glutamine methyltransferase [Halobacillus andaensis]MBP2004418.1 release factor glutamine methyltransferase [Halobacillus andaensis]GGF21789.1 release factor glutamine methyltransferase [Halobacillus andaensis]